MANFLKQFKGVLQGTKKNSQMVILVAILLVVAYPYIVKAYNGYLQSVRDKEAAQIQKEVYEKAEKGKEKQAILLKKYGITTLEYSYNYEEPNVYGLPVEVFDYLNAKKDVLDNKYSYTCENPPRIVEPKYLGLGDLRGLEELSKKIDTEGFLRTCEEIKKNKPVYDKFEKEDSKIKKLIDNNRFSHDSYIQKMIETLDTDYSKYVFLKKEI